ncbi:D-serine ammonia-lyase [Pseudomonas sp. S31]|nr:D-serine ammonia-lyase [Pseudomonas sp. S31]
MVEVIRSSDYLDRMGLTDQQLHNATHLAWGTGGRMVPDDEFDGCLAKGRGQKSSDR